MRRRIVPSLLLSALLLLPACKKKAGDASEDEVAAKGDDGKAAAEGKGDAEVPAEVPKEIEVPAAESGGAAPSAGGSGGGGGAASGGAVPAADREDLTCDPSVEGDCLEGEQCIGAQGCAAVWQCDNRIACKKGVREYCGCDGRTFEAVYGNCPWKKYEYEGPCK